MPSSEKATTQKLLFLNRNTCRCDDKHFMTISRYPILAVEGRWHLFVALLCGVLASWFFGVWSVIVWLLVGFVFQFFRDPKRRISTDAGAVVSPASGKIVAVEEADNPFLDGVKSVKVSIFMNVFSVHSNLIPVAGTVAECRYHRGAFFNAALDKASHKNERNAIWIKTDARCGCGLRADCRADCAEDFVLCQSRRCGRDRTALRFYSLRFAGGFILAERCAVGY